MLLTRKPVPPPVPVPSLSSSTREHNMPAPLPSSLPPSIERNICVYHIIFILRKRTCFFSPFFFLPCVFCILLLFLVLFFITSCWLFLLVVPFFLLISLPPFLPLISFYLLFFCSYFLFRIFLLLSRQVRNQGAVNLFRFDRVGRKEARGSPVPLRGRHPRAPGPDRDQHIHAGGDVKKKTSKELQYVTVGQNTWKT